MAITAIGPTAAGGVQPIVKDGYSLTYYPDVNNDALQKEGKPPVFYYKPMAVEIARKDGREDGDLMFNLIRFAGVQTGDTTVGVAAGDQREVAGGVLSFTVTSAPPNYILENGQQQIIDMYQGKSDFFWGIRSNVRPVFRPVPIVSNVTMVSNLSPDSDGSVPMPENSATAGGTAEGPDGQRARYALQTFRNYPVPPMITRRGFSARNFGRTRSGELEPWFWNLQGQGNGSIDPMGRNAYSALVGAYPAAIMWQAFHGAYSPIFVQQALKIKFWAPLVEIKIKGNWKRIFDHFSAHATGRYLWFSGDIKAEFNNLRISGDIEVEVNVDPTIPGAQDMSEYIEKRTELVYKTFEEQAKGAIFGPAPEVEAAQASSGGGLFGIWGAGLALKYRRDQASVNLSYHEKRQMAYLQDDVIGGTLEGIYDAIQDNPASERKYFTSVYLDDWPRKIGRVIKPVVRWPKPEQNWAGEPVAFVSAQVGYPNTKGELMWVGKEFNKSQPTDFSWNFAITQKEEADVQNPPQGWKADKTYVKRKVHMMEAPDQAENPFVQIQIEENVIDLDPGDHGTLMDDVTLEVRADSAGKLRIGPIDMTAYLEDSKQKVEVTFKAVDESGRDISRFPPVKLAWNYDDQEKPRFWSIFSGDDTLMPYFKYQVRCIVKGSFFSKGMEWTGPWVDGAGNGPISIFLPYPDDEGVTVKRTYNPEITSPAQPASPPSGTNDAPPATEPATPAAPPDAPPARGKNQADDAEEVFEIGTWKLEGATDAAGSARSASKVPPAAGAATTAPPADAARSAGQTEEIEVTSWNLE